MSRPRDIANAVRKMCEGGGGGGGGRGRASRHTRESIVRNFKKAVVEEETPSPSTSPSTSTNLRYAAHPITNKLNLWIVVKAYLDRMTLAQCQIAHYNKLIQITLPEYMNNSSFDFNISNDVNYRMIFSNLTFSKPSHKEMDGTTTLITPQEAIDRGVEYRSSIFVDVLTEFPDGHEPNYREHVFIGSMPVMVKSVLCNLMTSNQHLSDEFLYKHNEDLYDHGGYFIVKEGTSKFITIQEKLTTNMVSVYYNLKQQNWWVEIRSCNIDTDHETKTQISWYQGDDGLLMTIPHVNETIPWEIVMRALGVPSGEEVNMIDGVVAGEFDTATVNKLRESMGKYASMSVAEARKYLDNFGKSGSNYSVYLMAEMLCHIECENGLDYTPREVEEGETVEQTARRNNKHLEAYKQRVEEGRMKKARFICYMIENMLRAITDNRYMTDRDHFANKKVSTVCALIKEQFIMALKRLKNTLDNELARKSKSGRFVNPVAILKESIITNMMSAAIKDSTWTIKNSNSESITQTLEYTNALAPIAQIRKLVTPTDDDQQKLMPPRKLHSSHYGVICASETPEGKTCGLSKNLALTCYITLGVNSANIKQIVRGIISADSDGVYGGGGDRGGEGGGGRDRVIVDGDILCTIAPGSGHQLSKHLRHLRRFGNLTYDISIVYCSDVRCLTITTDDGRLARPLLIVEDGELVITRDDLLKIGLGKMTIDDLMVNGKLELIDKIEEEECFIAFYPEDITPAHTHCELDPCLIYGIGASTVPYANHNPSNRNTYQAAMSKQAIGMTSINIIDHVKGYSNVLNYPQRPICNSLAAEYIGTSSLPSGQNAVVGIMFYDGYNQEDSIILKKSSIERGFGVTTKFIEYTHTLRKGIAIRKPQFSDCTQMNGSTNKLDDKGVVMRGVRIQSGDIIIGCVSNNIGGVGGGGAGAKKPFVNESNVYKELCVGMVHAIIIGTNNPRVYTDLGRRDIIFAKPNGDGNDYIKVVIAQYRDPIGGDKFSARHGQKGTVGLIVPDEDMPYSMISGISPDIIVNPLAFPSRMTIAMVVEQLVGKTICATSLDENEKEWWDKWYHARADETTLVHQEFGDVDLTGNATPMRSGFSVKKFARILNKMGYNRFGCEIMIDGKTGQKMECLVYMGLVFYQRLKHMIYDKVQARARGPRNVIDNQPTTGKAALGGARIGCMERDAILANGCSAATMDRLLEQADIYATMMCGVCGKIPIYNKNDPSIKECLSCHSVELDNVKIPYVYKLFEQEMAGVCINMRSVVVPYKEDTIKVKNVET